MGFVIRFIVNAVAIWLAALLLDGLHLAEGEDTGTQVLIVAVVALVFTLVNMIVKPLVKLLSFPLYILTLGLFSLEVEGFWWAVAGGLIIGIVSWALTLVLPDGK